MTMPEHDPHQGSLFEIEDSVSQSPTTEPDGHKVRQESSFSPSPDGVYPETDSADKLEDINPGPSVTILERNQALGHAINKLASISRAEGLKKADTVPGFRSEIQGRYGNRYDEVTANTASKSEKTATKVPEDFAKAWGLEEVISSERVNESDARAAMAKDYRKFDGWFGGPGDGADRRDAKKRWLHYQQRKLTDQRTARPKVEYPRHPDSR